MRNVDPRDGFEIWVIDPANGTVEQVELDPAPQPVQTPAAVEVEKPPVAKKRQPRRPGTSAKAKKQPASKAEALNPGTAKKPRPATTAAKKKPARPRKRTPARKPQLVATASVEATSPATATTSKPTTRKPRPIRKKPAPPKPTAVAPASVPPPPAPHEPVLVASAADLVNPNRINEADALMVLELVCGKPEQPGHQPPQQQGSFEIRFVDMPQ